MAGIGCEREKAGHRRSRRARGDGAAALVEMALIIPILFTILFGIIIFGMLLSQRQNLAQAAAEGARAGAVAAAGNAQSDAKAAVDQAVQAFSQSCGNGNLVCGNGSLSPFTIAPCQYNGSVNCITVTLTLDARRVLPDIPLVGIFLPNTISASSTAEIS
jgi:Flp pilus assembly protein TadG